MMSRSGALDRVTFERCFGELLAADDPSESDQEIMSLIAARIFQVFDRDGNGTVDYSEFIAGISLLCRASSDDKIRAAFSLFDLDNGMPHHLTSHATPSITNSVLCCDMQTAS